MGVFTSALGQAFFSLSLGMGCILTYGSYLGRGDGIAASALSIVALDTSIALLAGFIIFPVGFSIAGFDPTTSGPGLIFTVLPRLFAEMPGGQLFGGAFFLLLSVAALTSTISLLEVPVSHCVDALGWTRRKAVAAVAGAVAVLAIPSALGNGAVGFFTSLPGFGMGFLDLMVIVWNEVALPVGGAAHRGLRRPRLGRRPRAGGDAGRGAVDAGPGGVVVPDPLGVPGRHRDDSRRRARGAVLRFPRVRFGRRVSTRGGAVRNRPMTELAAEPRPGRRTPGVFLTWRAPSSSPTSTRSSIDGEEPWSASGRSPALRRSRR